MARGGKALYGAPLGILMLDARFARIPGDMGNATTWPFPVRYGVVRGATPERVVVDGAAGLLPEFIAAARVLVADGAEAITTNCGFLSLFQAALQAAVPVPVATSALLQVPWVAALLPPGRQVGIITIAAKSLTPAHLEAARVPPWSPIVGLEEDGQELFPVLIRGEREDLDPALAEREVLRAGERLLAAHPTVGAIVLECSNLPPYAAALAAATGLPVFDAVTLGHWLMAGLRPRRWTSLDSR